MLLAVVAVLVVAAAAVAALYFTGVIGTGSAGEPAPQGLVLPHPSG